MFISLLNLIILSIISGYIFNDMFLGYGSLFFNNSIILFNYHYNFIDIEYIHPFIKNLPILLCLIIIYFINLLFLFINNNKFFSINKTLFKLFLNFSFFFYYALFFDKIYNEIYKKILNYTYIISTKIIDKGFLELFGPFGIYKFCRFFFFKLLNFIEPFIFYYLFIFFFCLFILLFFIVLIYLLNINIIYNHLGLIILLNLIIIF